MRLLFTVTQSLVVEKRGIVLFPGLPQGELLHGATTLTLELPNGTTVPARLAGMAHFGRKPGEPTPMLIARAPPDLEVPPGTRVFV